MDENNRNSQEQQIRADSGSAASAGSPEDEIPQGIYDIAAQVIRFVAEMDENYESSGKRTN